VQGSEGAEIGKNSVFLHCVVLSSAQGSFLLGLLKPEAYYKNILLNAGKSNPTNVK
jgi:hypothetical protein